eukprot:g36962.t1
MFSPGSSFRFSSSSLPKFEPDSRLLNMSDKTMLVRKHGELGKLAPFALPRLNPSSDCFSWERGTSSRGQQKLTSREKKATQNFAYCRRGDFDYSEHCGATFTPHISYLSGMEANKRDGSSDSENSIRVEPTFSNLTVVAAAYLVA